MLGLSLEGDTAFGVTGIIDAFIEECKKSLSTSQNTEMTNSIK